ncbi:MAG: undecaprenyl-phosphate glucose phosphotransferase [Ruminococcus flavefaciens]|nr:undecaprenyl-phosphate glucose phosphotransferase [Ruminococcus flavefaciens]
MIKENQRLLNRVNVVSDGLIIYAMLPLAFWLRFYVLYGGVIGKPLRNYLIIGTVITLIQLFTYAAFGLYSSQRKVRLRNELSRLWRASALDLAILFGWLFLDHGEHYSRIVLTLFFIMSVLLLSAKRFVMRKALRFYRQRGYNQKHVLLIGSGPSALKYLNEIRRDRELGYAPIGYVADKASPKLGLTCLGCYKALGKVLEQYDPDEVVSAVGAEDYGKTTQIISECEKAGVKLSIIPFYAEYMPSNPHFDDLNGIPLLNIRHIPLDNPANAFAKRAMDIVGAGMFLILSSPLMLICAIGVKLSSPGPVVFSQERIGRNKKPFMMYKFRSMRVNDKQDSGWSTKVDSRRTRFGSFLRKFSIDEFLQFWNVLKGDMSLVGPRPELPKFVDEFKEEFPLYMVRHQVRPGITGWAQVNGLRGDTSIKSRVEYDIYYIEHWSLLFDLQILLITVFGAKFINDEQLG